MKPAEKQFWLSFIDGVVLFAIIAFILSLYGYFLWGVLLLGLLIPYALLRRKIFPMHKPSTGKEGMVGLTGTAEGDMDMEVPGWIKVSGELWAARSRDQVSKGDEVSIVGIEDLTLIVERKSI